MRQLILAIALSLAVQSARAAPEVLTSLPGAEGLENLGMLAIRTPLGFHLQAHDDNGELHASNPHRNEEETWFILKVADTGRYAFYNWKSGKFLGRIPINPNSLNLPPPLADRARAFIKNCAPASLLTLSSHQEWELVLGLEFDVRNAVALKRPGTNQFLVNKGSDTLCGGEVYLQEVGSPPRDGTWGGWWVLEGTTAPPTPGRNIWNTVGNYFLGVLNKISPADLLRLFMSGKPG